MIGSRDYSAGCADRLDKDRAKLLGFFHIWQGAASHGDASGGWAPVPAAHFRRL